MNFLSGMFQGNDEILEEGIREGNLDKVKLAIFRRADPNKPQWNGVPIFFQSVSRNNIEIFRYLVKNGAEINTPLRRPIPYQNSIHQLLAGTKPVEWLQILDENGARWDGVFGDALLEAIRRNRQDNIEYLITKVNINYTSKSYDYSFNCPLHYAIGRNSPNILITYLLDNGADVNKRDGYDYTPLYLSIYRPDILELLIERGANLNLQCGPSQYTALLAAVASKQIESVRILVEAGANKSIPDIYGITPLQRATYMNNQELIDLLQEDEPIDIEAAEHRGYFDIEPETTNAIEFVDIEDGDEVVVLFNNPNYLYKKNGFANWIQQRQSQGLPITNPKAPDLIVGQKDIVRYTARVAGKMNNENPNENGNNRRNNNPRHTKRPKTSRKRKGGSKKTKKQSKGRRRYD